MFLCAALSKVFFYSTKLITKKHSHFISKGYRHTPLFNWKGEFQRFSTLFIRASLDSLLSTSSDHSATLIFLPDPVDGMLEKASSMIDATSFSSIPDPISASSVSTGTVTIETASPMAAQQSHLDTVKPYPSSKVDIQTSSLSSATSPIGVVNVAATSPQTPTRILVNTASPNAGTLLPTPSTTIAQGPVISPQQLQTYLAKGSKLIKLSRKVHTKPEERLVKINLFPLQITWETKKKKLSSGNFIFGRDYGEVYVKPVPFFSRLPYYSRNSPWPKYQSI